MEIHSLGPEDRWSPGCPAPRRRSPPDSRLQLQAPPPPRKLIPHTAPRCPTSIVLRRLGHHLAEIERLRQEEEIDLARRRKEFGTLASRVSMQSEWCTMVALIWHVRILRSLIQRKSYEKHWM
ncbi:unnamed protein product [Urochloa humidicola]